MAKNDKPIPTVSVKALVTVNYDGTLYGPGLPDGDTFDCRETDVAQLQDVGAIEEVAADPAPAQ
jgi:hypothetical protein